jgi:hypothetical protein
MISLFIHIMTLLAANMSTNPDTIDTFSSLSMIEAQQTSNAENNNDPNENKQWKMRPYNPTFDHEHLIEICKDIYGGSDYLPSTAMAYHNDPNCDFQVLACRETNIPVACANLRCMSNNGDGSSAFWLEAVRTSSKHRNQGLGYRLLQSQLQTRLSASDDPSMPTPIILSCTVQSNLAMGRVFDKVGMKHTSTLRLLKFDTLKALPGWAADDSDIPCTKHLLAALNMQDLVSDSVKQKASGAQAQPQWCVVKSTDEACQLIRDVQSHGGGYGQEHCCMMPGFYELIHVHSSTFQESLEQGLVLSLTSIDGISPPAIMVFVRDTRITSLKSKWVLSVATTTEENLQSALWEGCTSPDIQRKLQTQQCAGTPGSDISNTKPQSQKDGNHDEAIGFALAFDGAVPIDGRFCSKLPLADDPCFVYGMD